MLRILAIIATFAGFAWFVIDLVGRLLAPFPVVTPDALFGAVLVSTLTAGCVFVPVFGILTVVFDD